MTAATPLRLTEPAVAPQIDESTSSYTAHLLNLVESVDDRSSWSDELAIAGRAWPDSYYVHPSRANMLRTMPIAPDGVVLELGARAGALTRHLGEAAGIVDSLEADPALAAVAVARCRGLDQVAVRVGTIHTVPGEGVYDVVVVAEILHEIAVADMSLAQFVARCRSLLRPGGLLVLGADNSEGVRATVGGAPPVPPVPSAHMASVSVTELEAAVTAAGLSATTLSAFPDHVHTHLLYSHPRLSSLHDSFLVELPKFSVPASAPTHVDDAAQKIAWQAMVSNGSAERHANSLVVVASEAGLELDDAATFWSIGRSAALSACNRVRLESGRPAVMRTQAFPVAPDPDEPLHFRPHTEPVARGVAVADAVAASPTLSRAADLLHQWSALVETAGTSGSTVPWDLIPRNVVVGPDGSMTAIDQEWEFAGSDAETVRSRGFFWLAHDLATSPRLPPWLPAMTVGQTATFLRHISHTPTDLFWLSRFFDIEAHQSAGAAPTSARQSRILQVFYNKGALMALSQSSRANSAPVAEPTPDDAESVSAMREALSSVFEENESLRQRVRDLELEQRHLALAHRDHVIGLIAETESVRDKLQRKYRESRRHKEQALRLQKQVTAMKASTTWRIGSRIVRPFSRIGRRGRR